MTLKDKIKSICGLGDSSYDTIVDNFIEIYKTPLENQIKEEFINNIEIKTVIDTGICEIISGCILDSIDRNTKESEISLSSFTYKEKKISGNSLIEQGYNKLKPFLKDYTPISFLADFLT